MCKLVLQQNTKMLYSEIIGEIIGASMEVHKNMGRGFQEYFIKKPWKKN